MWRHAGDHQRGCAAARNKGTCENRLNIRIDVLEAEILDGLRHRLMAPDLFKEFCQEFHREVNRLRNTEYAVADSEKAELIQVELAGILELCREGANRKPGSLSTAGLAEQIKWLRGYAPTESERSFEWRSSRPFIDKCTYKSNTYTIYALAVYWVCVSTAHVLDARAKSARACAGTLYQRRMVSSLVTFLRT